MTWQGVSEAECYDNRSVIAQIVRIKDRLTAVEQNVDPTLREDLTAAIAELTALENTVGNVETQVEANTGSIAQVQDNVDALEGEVETALTTKADKTELTDGSVTKVGTADVGSGTGPIYLAEGTPTACDDAFFIAYTGNGTGNRNYGKALEFSGSKTSQYPFVKMTSGNIILQKSQYYKMTISQSSMNIDSDITEGKPVLIADKGSVNTCFHYYARTDISTSAAATKPWNVRIHMSGNKTAADCMIATPDGVIRFMVTNIGGTQTPPLVQTVTTVTGVSIVACSLKTSSTENDVYIRIPTVYDANNVCVTVLDASGLKAQGTTAEPAITVSQVTYEDVVNAGGLTIPNLANYDANYVWQSVA